MNGLSFLRRLLPSSGRRRLEALAARGALVEVRRHEPHVRLIRIDLGYGPELWEVSDAQVAVARNPARVEHARLLVHDGSPRDALRRVDELSLPYERIWMRW